MDAAYEGSLYYESGQLKVCDKQIRHRTKDFQMECIHKEVFCSKN